MKFLKLIRQSCIFLHIFFYFPLVSFGKQLQSIPLLMSPNSSVEEFVRFRAEHSQYIDYATLQLNTVLRDPSELEQNMHDELREILLQGHLKPRDCLKLNDLLTDRDLSRTEIDFIQEFFIKMEIYHPQKENCLTTLKNYFRPIWTLKEFKNSTANDSEYSNSTLHPKHSESETDFNYLKSKFLDSYQLPRWILKNFELATLNGIPIKFGNLDRVLFPSDENSINKRYRWVFYSSRFYKLNFVGTMKELQNLDEQLPPFLTSGSCENPMIIDDSLNLHMIGHIFFNESCVKAVKPKIEDPSKIGFFNKNRKWMLGVGALIGILAWTLKDQAIVIQTY